MEEATTVHCLIHLFETACRNHKTQHIAFYIRAHGRVEQTYKRTTAACSVFFYGLGYN